MPGKAESREAPPLGPRHVEDLLDARDVGGEAGDDGAPRGRLEGRYEEGDEARAREEDRGVAPSETLSRVVVSTRSSAKSAALAITPASAEATGRASLAMAPMASPTCRGVCVPPGPSK